MEESKLIRGNGTLLPRGGWPWSASSHPFSVRLGHLVVIGIFTNLPPRWNRTLLFSCQKAVVISGFQGGSFPKWEYTEILITLEMLSKPRCRALASATSPEHFIAHKSCSRLIKHCWSLPRSHEKVTHSPSLPTYQRLLLLLQRQSDFFFCFKHDFRFSKLWWLHWTQSFSVQRNFCFLHLLLLFFFSLELPLASCSSAFTLLWTRPSHSHLCNDLCWL